LRGEGSIAEVNEPGREPSLLALHGFSATPNEVLMLTELAAEFGLGRRAPLLPGHGTHARDLARTCYEDWYAHAEHALLELSAKGPVIVGGQSMGAVVALDLACRHPERVLGLIALANATRLASPFPDLFLAVARHLPPIDFALPKFGGSDVRDPEMRYAHVTYSTQPMQAALHLRAAGLRVLDQLHKVRCPTFVAHGRYDAVCPVSNAWQVCERLGTQDVELVLLQRSAHILTKDLDRDYLRQRIRRFMLRLRGVHRVSAPPDAAVGAATPRASAAQPRPVEP
jgi:carboxylesterase